LFKKTLKSMLQGGQAAPPTLHHPPVGHQGKSPPASSTPPKTRQSNGFDQLVHVLREQEGLSVLDFGGVSQANVNFIIELGHRMYSEDFLMVLDSAFGREDPYANQSDPERANTFLSQVLDFRENSFDAALVWDNLQFLAPPLLEEIVGRLYHILRPNACLLAFFHADEKAAAVPVYSYRVSDPKTLLLAPRGLRKPAQVFNNRSLERLFHQFQSVKFFLTRDALREVIVRR
jgi:hypothetical protein